MISITQAPVVQAEMLIRKPAAEVFEAFVNPEITTRFWFTRSSGRLEAGKKIRWDWEMYGVGDDIHVLAIEENRRIRIESSDGTQTEWLFTPRGQNETFVAITPSGFAGDGDSVVQQAIDSMGGYTMVLCGLKALLEHNVVLNLVADKSPDAHVT
ncbi:SRPBCC family protein [Paenibacillus mucilaginosus]|uniref:Activator of Hsp90 ATPase 1 family protein n=3 Tax=Paenibacillus mucilaginosus TaxID=61624 RepID=H6NK26_9BACL|nr:SRPBCC family protein [Paenibacillus mucilaginosus]AEI43219.1 Activator of Hsp90 ATPase 1 family protein [Paenibacillus mucilaginosus KNP414]AFC30879.1 Activator of Hsp90 ATPase 1 family protein [Paenibacillus mucilaginosus 3016]AFH63204.1 activator of HSP90 ATPase [Paenibacillus mucilaginosus K02]MCG7212223.1 SRPBCC family protein [Paenibacillus mucilaginosus]WDM24810.1 SRPBCC family protein [Paenibacillus mucilaginosus]